MKNYLTVLVTVPNEEMAVTISRTLVQERLAACVQIIDPIRSIYMWKNEVCDDSELLLFIKSTVMQFENLKKRVIELHTYETPEIIALPISNGLDSYLNWITEVTSKSD